MISPYLLQALLASLLFHCISSYRSMRLGLIEGFEGRQNEIVYVAPRASTRTTDLVVFFPGDVQNYGENMLKIPKYSVCLGYNLEAVAEDLSAKFPGKHVIVIKPKTIVDGLLNFYDNFVKFNKFHAPDHSKGRFALPHLHRLLKNILTSPIARPYYTLMQKVASRTAALSLLHEEGNPSDICGTLDQCRIDTDQQQVAAEQAYDGGAFELQSTTVPEIDSVAVVGFSKGCVVLNQLVTEIYLMSELPDEERNLCSGFLQKVVEMAWLDGGHQGREGTWLTNPNLVNRLVQTLPHLNITIHVTPYQVLDQNRPWIGNECRRFESLCRAATSHVSFRMLGEDSPRPTDLLTHFLALEAYGK